MTVPGNPFAPFLEAQQAIVLDGGLATTLEAFGCALDAKLWSAGLLRDDPGSVRAVHQAFLEAGADCIATVTYQASFQGFAEVGLTDAEALELFGLAVRLAVEERDRFWSVEANRRARLRPLVAASIGPYGAYLADGSEYDGRYGLGVDELRRFHRRRFELMAESAADLVALETIPSVVEAEALLGILADSGSAWAWISFSCPDGAHISDGTPVEEVARLCDGSERLCAIGVNCTAPTHVPEIVRRMCSATELPVLAYPNSGEGWDAGAKRWTPAGVEADLSEAVVEWVREGARGVGGCCRVGPETIRHLRERALGT